MAWKHSEASGLTGKAFMAFQGRTFDSMKSWLHRYGQFIAFAWLREDGRYGRHTHMALHLDPALRDDLHQHILKAGRFNADPAGIVITPDDRPCMATAFQRSGLLRYFLKQTSPIARFDGRLVMLALGVDNQGRGPCTTEGKRSGVSHSIGRATRAAAGWRELVTLPELHAVLHPPKRKRFHA
ncbi:hypothetical protein [Falsiroseomonas sp. E2-1-a20]|uniref:hypothetical protein n=1 Tax=Falsiroseomonas sp. E2-1-a20 TaxID=3239300 RepID=UPI003F3AD414